MVLFVFQLYPVSVSIKFGFGNVRSERVKKSHIMRAMQTAKAYTGTAIAAKNRKKYVEQKLRVEMFPARFSAVGSPVRASMVIHDFVAAFVMITTQCEPING